MTLRNGDYEIHGDTLLEEIEINGVKYRKSE